MNYAPSQPLTSEEKDLIWKFRFYLTRDKRGLTKFLKSVTWRDPSEVKQAVEELLPQWTEIDIDDALELLGPGTVDSRVRAFAVKQLDRADDEVCLNVLSSVLYSLIPPSCVMIYHRSSFCISFNLFRHSSLKVLPVTNDQHDQLLVRYRMMIVDSQTSSLVEPYTT